MLAATASAYAQHYTVDRTASDALTAYLHKHRFPLVGGEVLQASGSQRVVLYGFVASDRGKQDAQSRVLRYLGKSDAQVDNRIAVRPEIAQLKSAPTKSAQTASDAAAPSASDAQDAPVADAQDAAAPGGSTKSFGQVLDEIQRYGIKSPPD